MENTYTVFCQLKGESGGTTHITSVTANSEMTARFAARRETASNWDCDPSEIHVLGIAAGDVEILEWADQDDSWR